MKLVNSDLDAAEKARDLTDTDIIALLRSDQSAARQAGLEAVYPNDSAVLVHVSGKGTAVASTGKIDPSKVFAGLLFISQQVAAVMGLQLNWIQQPSDGRKLVIANEVPVMPGGQMS
jgi:hypothetical protein